MCSAFASAQVTVGVMRPLPPFARQRDGVPRRSFSWPAVARLGLGAAMVVALAGWDFSGRPTPASPDGGGKLAPSMVAEASARSSFSSIILPDLLVVVPRGLSSAAVARLRAIKGVIK